MNYLWELWGILGTFAPFPVTRCRSPFEGVQPARPVSLRPFPQQQQPRSSPPRSSPAGLRWGLRWFSRYTSQICPFFWRNGTLETDALCI